MVLRTIPNDARQANKNLLVEDISRAHFSLCACLLGTLYRFIQGHQQHNNTLCQKWATCCVYCFIMCVKNLLRALYILGSQWWSTQEVCGSLQFSRIPSRRAHWTSWSVGGTTDPEPCHQITGFQCLYLCASSPLYLKCVYFKIDKKWNYYWIEGNVWLIRVVDWKTAVKFELLLAVELLITHKQLS